MEINIQNLELITKLTIIKKLLLNYFLPIFSFIIVLIICLRLAKIIEYLSSINNKLYKINNKIDNLNKNKNDIE